ncbi:mitochondrial transcription rescue factor 1 [Topomyia yanbarensis]|uniref:mitochondrial transcription rescue factor 1 n=1 Tax=Topomyia yanbarensis TaxID=2498891 RepID=UPI00273C0F06|nr:mitochondrial transcription rescue factor 1 [Topomyia yanbarensis]
MSFILQRTFNRSIFSLLKQSFPQVSYCCLERSTYLLDHHRSYVGLAVTSTEVLHNQNIQLLRFKSKKANRKEQSGGAHEKDEDDDDDDDDHQLDAYDELVTDKHTKLVKTSVSSLRADLILKAGLGIARNKVENLFYESKIRVNGRKLLKKSTVLDVGDEIDVVKGTSPTNPDHLIVSRVEILGVTPKSESISVNLRRHKSLIIENYETDAVIEDK